MIASPRNVAASLRHTHSVMQLGLFGGTFDPIHEGHLAVAHAIIHRKHCDRILFIPSGAPPHKRIVTVTPIEHRREMVRLAIAGNAALQLSDIDDGGPSYSYQTVEAIRSRDDGNTSLSFIIGLDNLFDLPNWREPQSILKVCTLIVVSRPGWEFARILNPLHNDFFGMDVEPECLEALDIGTCAELVIHPKPGTNHFRSMTFLRAAVPDISSSEIRMAVARQHTVHALLPASVQSYILNTGLYTAGYIYSES